jgi:hypothetical protein
MERMDRHPVSYFLGDTRYLLIGIDSLEAEYLFPVWSQI